MKLISFHARVDKKVGRCVIGQERSEFEWGRPTFVSNSCVQS